MLIHPYGAGILAAAQELAKHPESQNDEKIQSDICKKYGVFLDNMTNDELECLSRLVEDFY